METKAQPNGPSLPALSARGDDSSPKGEVEVSEEPPKATAKRPRRIGERKFKRDLVGEPETEHNA